MKPTITLVTCVLLCSTFGLACSGKKSKLAGEQVSLYLAGGYQEDYVTLRVDDKILCSEKISTDPSSGLAKFLDFRCTEDVGIVKIDVQLSDGKTVSRGLQFQIGQGSYIQLHLFRGNDVNPPEVVEFQTVAKPDFY
ncbi:hypothetical protein [Verrucomicrobium sp. BvORR034]|uniref:hypothetical protein n=1 Tax=Verrucomicrobium sp. BvORR034 TaxID=1396418 RepID=UPI0006794193|nr:hypothetical protein [Verrucomicrobium sp. BvORR034]